LGWHEAPEAVVRRRMEAIYIAIWEAAYRRS
jgi:hypothetical protein